METGRERKMENLATNSSGRDSDLAALSFFHEVSLSYRIKAYT